MNINGVEYIERSAFDELHRVNMALVDASRVTVHELARLRAIESAAQSWLDFGQRIVENGCPDFGRARVEMLGKILRGEKP